MDADQMQWPVLITINRGRDEFIRFWDKLYSGYAEEFYRGNIGKTLTGNRIQMWFEWKNGGQLSIRKRRSIQQYSSPEERLPLNADQETVRAFLRRPGGAIWRIFWLHLQHPAKYPIYDQHVHRAMAFLLDWGNLEIPKRDSDKVRTYLDSYLTFCEKFRPLPHRQIDRALWAFGKFLKSGYRKTLESSF